MRRFVREVDRAVVMLVPGCGTAGESGIGAFEMTVHHRDPGRHDVGGCDVCVGVDLRPHHWLIGLGALDGGGRDLVVFCHAHVGYEKIDAVGFLCESFDGRRLAVASFGGLLLSVGVVDHDFGRKPSKASADDGPRNHGDPPFEREKTARSEMRI